MVMIMSNQKYTNIEFTKEMKKTHTIYMPDMVHYHNDLLCAAFAYGGYHLSVVPEYPLLTKNTFSMINKDYCTCATYIVGNLLTMLEDKNIDSSKVAFLEPQAGGASRAGNYYNLIINCLKNSGYAIPVLSLNAHGFEKHSGFSINGRMLLGAVAAVCYGDLLMMLYQQVRPYEINKGEAKAMWETWINKLSELIKQGKGLFRREKIYREIISDFQKIKRNAVKKKKVGIVGEIYIKYSPIGNNHLEDFLIQQDVDYRQSIFLNYCIYVVYTEMKSMELDGKGKAVLSAYEMVIKLMLKMQKELYKELDFAGFSHDGYFEDLRENAKEIISEYYNIGDGWLMTGETIDMIKNGFDKVMMVHPFGCLVSHVGEQGVIRKLKNKYPEAKVTSVEFDYEQADALRESRILLAIN